MTCETTTFPSSPMPELTGQTAGWLDLMRAGDTTARQRLIEHACERLRGLARKMLRRYPKVRRWEETDDVFVEAITRLHRALENRPARVPEALLQPGGDPDPPRPHRPVAPVLRSRGTRQPSRHGGAECRGGYAAEVRTGGRVGRARQTSWNGRSSTSRSRRCPRRNARCSTSSGTNN